MKAKPKKKAVAKEAKPKKKSWVKKKIEEVKEAITHTPPAETVPEQPTPEAAQTTPTYPKLRIAYPDLTEEDFVGSEAEVIRKVCEKTRKSYDEIQPLVRV